MEKEYIIQVDMTPKDGVYCWTILECVYDDYFDENVVKNVDYGWSKTPAIAWSDAYHKYLELTNTRENEK